VNFFEIIR